MLNNHFSRIRFIFSLVVSAALFAVGCQKDPLFNAKSAAGSFDYENALLLLDENEQFILDVKEFQRLKSLYLLSNGKVDSGFAYLLSAVELNDITKRDVLLRAVENVLRTRNNVPIGIDIMRRAVQLMPEMSNWYSDVIWTRGVEFMSNRGIEGYQLLGFGTEIDPALMGRLQQYNPILIHKYREVMEIQIKVNQWQQKVKVYKDLTGVNPHTIHDLALLSGGDWSDTLRKEWQYSIRIDSSEAIVVATVNFNHPNQIPYGTEVIATNIGK